MMMSDEKTNNKTTGELGRHQKPVQKEKTLSEDNQNEGVSQSAMSDAVLENKSVTLKKCTRLNSDGLTRDENPSPDDRQHLSAPLTATGITSKSQTSLQEALKGEKEFIDYVMSLPKTSPVVETKPFTFNQTMMPNPNDEGSSPSSSAKLGLDHLDNLCKIMQQLGELRQTNTKQLNKKVLYLEDMKSLEKMHQEMKQQSLSSSPLLLMPDVAVASSSRNSRSSSDLLSSSPINSKSHSILQHPLSSDGSSAKLGRLSPGLNKKDQRRCAGVVVHKSRSQLALTGSDLKRQRSKSVGHEELRAQTKARRKSTGRRFPKWSRFKEALGWDKVPDDQPVVCKENKKVDVVERQMSSHLDYEDYLHYNISDSEDFDKIDFDSNNQSGIEHISADELLIVDGNPASVIGQSNKRSAVEANETYRRSSTPPQFTKNWPWTRVKTMIQTRKDSIKKTSTRKKSSSIRGNDQQQQQQQQKKNPSANLSVEVLLSPTEGGNRFQSARSLTDISPNNLKVKQRHNEASLSDAECYKKGESSRHYLSVNQPTESALSTQSKEVNERRTSKTKPPPKNLIVDTKTSDNSKPSQHKFIRSKSRTISSSTAMSGRTPSRSPPVQRKSRWNRMKKVFANVEVKPIYDSPELVSKSVPASPGSLSEVSFSYDELLDPSGDDRHLLEVKTKEKKKKIEYATPSPVETLVQELQRNLSDDFSKKLMEWEKIRSGESHHTDERAPIKEAKNFSSRLSTKKRKSERSSVENKITRQKVKDLNWLDKELQKIERERQRLAKEKQKFEERLIRLQKLKDSVINSKNTSSEKAKKEILIRTAAGEFRFEGISDDFTKKLYEWETIREVRPELSTIALLDSNKKLSNVEESLSKEIASKSLAEKRLSLQKGLSKSENSILEANGNHSSHQTSSNSLPSINNIQKDAVSEPDIRILPGPSTIESTDVIKKEKKTSVDNFIRNYQLMSKKKSLNDCETNLSNEDNYYNLLEENMYLLEQLKTKEEICRRLEGELTTLDDRMIEMNSAHQQEMERFRDKLWEVHAVGVRSAKPKDLQRSLKLITELKDKIEELQHCSERLKCDKETLEDSFRYHSQQQAKLTVDLIEKMKELQHISISSGSTTSEGRRSKRWKGYVKCDNENVTKLHDLSTLLLQQARELEHSLIEKTRQICRLRWELLNRDVSAMRLQTELQHAKVQQNSITAGMGQPNAAEKRNWYSQRRSWSSSEALCLKLIERENNNDESLQNRYNRLSTMIYSDWPKLDCDINELSATVQQLKMEILKLTIQMEQQSNSEEANSGGDSPSQENTNAKKYNGLMTSPLFAELLPDFEDYYLRTSGADKDSSCRRSVDNISSVSGQGSEESSSLNENDLRASYFVRLPSRKKVIWRRSRDNVSTSSESSFIEEESFTAVQWCRPRTSSDFGSNNSADYDNINNTELVLDYGNGREAKPYHHRDYHCRGSTSRSSSEMTDQRADSWGDIYKHRSGGFHFPGQLSETSSSAFNEVEESSSTSGNRMTSIDNTPDSTQSNLRSSSSSGQGMQPNEGNESLESPTWKTRIENEVIPEGCALPAAERRHSDPDRRFKFNKIAVKSYESNDLDTTTSMFTVILPRKPSAADSEPVCGAIQEESQSENVDVKQTEDRQNKEDDSKVNRKLFGKESESTKPDDRSLKDDGASSKTSDHRMSTSRDDQQCQDEVLCSQSMSSIASLSDASQKRLSATSDSSTKSSGKSSSLSSRVSSQLMAKLKKSGSKTSVKSEKDCGMPAVAALCRQSLMVDIDNCDEGTGESRSPSLQEDEKDEASNRNKKWFDRFKK